MSGYIAVINAGSSSIKFALCEPKADVEIQYRGQIEGIGVNPRLTVRNAQGEAISTKTWPVVGFDHGAAAQEILHAGARLAAGSVVGVGHRVVHGGLSYGVPVRLDQTVLAALSRLIPLAPLHQPHNLSVIKTIFQAAPHLPQVACFDTAFHRTQPPVAQAFALPRDISEAGIRRYGFHGLSYEYLSGQMRALYPEMARGRVIMAHLGNGASLCAMRNGRSMASTMGFTAADGLMMGTRCGALDPGVILHLITEHHMDAAGLEDLIYRKSGLLGVSGLSSDMRTLRASPEPAAQEAIALFVYRIIREIGSLVAALDGLDALVFAGGIGENDAATRADVVQGCRWTGMVLDAGLNSAGKGRISSDQSPVTICVIPTDEERLIAQHTKDVLALGSH
ncbi:MAG: acetate kinase [Rhodospirillales bacterium 20-64-7]|nr:MAG: acetate kinase [Rhodospirillales bacterium 20-64-7]HQT77207.1 acetate/propionate family kinase [Rhodopila sp.]